MGFTGYRLKGVGFTRWSRFMTCSLWVSALGCGVHGLGLMTCSLCVLGTYFVAILLEISLSGLL